MRYRFRTKVNELNDLPSEAREIVLSRCIYDALVRSSRTHDGTIKGTYIRNARRDKWRVPSVNDRAIL